MFGFANLLLLGLFAGGLYLGAVSIARKTPLREMLSPAGEQRLLFGSWGTGWRETLGQVCFLAALGSHLFQIAFLHSQLNGLYPEIVGPLDALLDTLLGICVMIKILLGTRYNGYQLGFGFCVYFILRWAHFNSHNIFFITALFLVMAAKDVPLRKSLKLFLAVNGGSTAFIMLSSLVGLLGLTPTHTIVYWYGDSGAAVTLGYTHWNALGGLLLGTTLGWALLRREKLSWPDYLGIAIIGALTFFVVDSKTTGLLIFGVVVCCLIDRFLPGMRRWKALPWLGAAGAALLAVGSAAEPTLLKGEVVIGQYGQITVEWWPAILQKLDVLLTGRLFMMMEACKHLTVKIAGQMIPEFPPIDNCYLYTLLILGPVAFALVWAGAAVTVFRLLRRGRLLPGLLLLVALVYALMEVQYLHMNANPTLLLLAGAVWGERVSE